MSCCADSLSWFTAPVATTTTRTIATTYFKPSAISCYVKNQADSTSSSSSGGSYRRRWYNPLRRRHLTDTPDIQRHWIEANVDSSIPSQERFTVLSYNILGDKNALKHRDLYRNVPSIYLTWDYRKRIICEELIGRNPDIICLQEVDRYFDLSKIMDKAGYMGSYKRRTGGCADGCAIFWKADKFHLLEAEGIEFKQYGLRDNVAQILVFEADV